MSNKDILLEKDVNTLLESRMYDIYNNAMIEHDQMLIKHFKELSEKLKTPNKHLTNDYSAGEVAGVEYCIYILESLIERRLKDGTV